MPQDFGNLSKPCTHIQRSEAHIDQISRSARANAESGSADESEVEAGLTELKASVEERLRQACTGLCGQQDRCILDSFGPNDPLITKRNLTADEERELKAKVEYDELRALSEMSLGIFLG